MNLYRFIILLFLSIFLMQSVIAEKCIYGELGNTCETISSEYNIFNLDLTPQNQLESFEVRLYNKNNPSNEIRLVKGEDFVRNINPLTQQGVYVLEVEAKNRGGHSTFEDYEFIFNNIEPLPPIVPIKISTTSNSVLISGSSRDAQTVFVKNSAGIISSANVENGQFTISVSNLESGYNKVDFYSSSHNGLESQVVERKIYSGPVLIENENSQVNNILMSPLESLNERTSNQLGNIFTNKRNFYVEGVLLGASPGAAQVYVQGVKTLSDYSGKFGAFVILNEGENIIEIESNGVKKSINVFYTKLNFRILELDLPSIVSTQSLSISGKVNLDVPFAIYLNGKLEKIVDIFSSQGNEFIFQETLNLKEGKNYLVIEGFGGEKFSRYIYFDSSSPEAEYVGLLNINSVDDLIFRVKDDTRISNSDLVLTIGSNSYAQEDFLIQGDYYRMSSEDQVVSSQLNFEVKDATGKSVLINPSINLDPNNVVIESIFVEGGDSIGRLLFLRGGRQRIILEFSDSVAFENIFFDEEEVLDYHSNLDSSVEINLDVRETKGELKIVYFDSNKNRYEETFNYISDLEKPKLEFDYIEESESVGDGIRVTGRVIDSNFNWESFRINSEEVRRYGDNFEVDIVPNRIGTSNLEIEGRDYSFNSIEPNLLGGILFEDGTYSDIVLGDTKKNKIELVIQSSDPQRVHTYVDSYDGFDLRNVHILRSDFLPVHEREGLRSINFKGTEESSQRINSKEIFSIDNSRPQAYLINHFGEYKILLDGTLSEVSHFSIKVNGEDATLSTCLEKVSVYSKCRVIQDFVGLNSIISVQVEDLAGNSLSETFSALNAKSFDEVLGEDERVEIFFTGNDLNLQVGQNALIQGHIKTNDAIEEVMLSDGTSCEFDDYNFVCNSLYSETLNKSSFVVSVFTLKRVDSDNDGVINLYDNCDLVPNSNQADYDGDGKGDLCDDDIDNDNREIVYGIDRCPYNAFGDHGDIDLDGLGAICDDNDDGDNHLDVDDNCISTINNDQSDFDNDGIGDACDESDLDDDGIKDFEDNCIKTPNSGQEDSDNNGIGDVCDDSDGDSIMFEFDNCPFVANTNQINTDFRLFGLPQGDLIGDICDSDDDNDGVNDSFINAQGVLITFTPEDNCRLTYNPLQVDLDRDGVGDVCDDDIDNDGYENFEDNCVEIPNDQSDEDLDGLGNVCDSDDDGDGVPDTEDSCPFNVNIGDNDNDGIDDSCDDLLDSDGDLRPDETDTCPLDSQGDHRDTDGDGLGNVCDDNDDGDSHLDVNDNCVLIVNNGQENNDGDLKGDVCDSDDDNDSYDDLVDNCVLIPNEDQLDLDRDGVGDLCDEDIDNDNREISLGVDTCPYDALGDHGDIDRDGLGNVCDSDDDGDGELDGVDNCPGISNPDQADFDNNGIGDGCDDRDGDGIEDNQDNCKRVSNFLQKDSDNNGIGDVCDDSDGDFHVYEVDNCPEISNPLQADYDGDGLGDLCDSDDDNDGFEDEIDFCQFESSQTNLDTDGDGVGDVCDTDDDNDGIPDAEDNLTIVYNDIPRIDLIDVSGTGVFRLSDVYHTVIPQVLIDASLNYPALVRVLVGNNVYLRGLKEGNFTIQLNFSEQVEGISVDEKEFELYLEAENQIDEIGLSERIRLVYDRVLKAIVRVVVD